MTELNNEVRELTVDELDGVSGGIALGHHESRGR